MVLETAGERIRLLKAGYTGREIERLYMVLNSFEIMSIHWQISCAQNPAWNYDSDTGIL